jgi:hypothetical protein
MADLSTVKAGIEAATMQIVTQIVLQQVQLDHTNKAIREIRLAMNHAFVPMTTAIMPIAAFPADTRGTKPASTAKRLPDLRQAGDLLLGGGRLGDGVRVGGERLAATGGVVIAGDTTAQITTKCPDDCQIATIVNRQAAGPGPGGPPEHANLQTKTVPELKELCAQARLTKTGKKQELVDKLARHRGGGTDGGAGAGAGGSRGARARGDDGGGGQSEGGAPDITVRRDRHGKILCHHNRRKIQCKQCGGSAICEHGRARTHCKQCGGSQICEHDRTKSQCKQCGGSAICGHGRRKSECKECGGSALCEQRKARCKARRTAVTGVAMVCLSGPVEAAPTAEPEAALAPAMPAAATMAAATMAAVTPMAAATMAAVHPPQRSVRGVVHCTGVSAIGTVPGYILATPAVTAAAVPVMVRAVHAVGTVLPIGRAASVARPIKRDANDTPAKTQRQHSSTVSSPVKASPMVVGEAAAALSGAPKLGPSAGTAAGRANEDQEQPPTKRCRLAEGVVAAQVGGAGASTGGGAGAQVQDERITWSSQVPTMA